MICEFCKTRIVNNSDSDSIFQYGIVLCFATRFYAIKLIICCTVILQILRPGSGLSEGASQSAFRNQCWLIGLLMVSAILTTGSIDNCH